jgi:hypothetical protein
MAACWVPELEHEDRELLAKDLSQLREYADELGASGAYTAPMGALAAHLEAAAHQRKPPVDFTMGELEIIAMALELASMLDNLLDEATIKALKALRVKALSIGFERAAGR